MHTLKKDHYQIFYYFGLTPELNPKSMNINSGWCNNCT